MMHEKVTGRDAKQGERPEKRRYTAPVFQLFGSVTELTNSAAGSCMDDADNNQCSAAGSMSMQ